MINDISVHISCLKCIKNVVNYLLCMNNCFLVIRYVGLRQVKSHSVAVLLAWCDGSPTFDYLCGDLSFFCMFCRPDVCRRYLDKDSQVVYPEWI